MPVAPRSIFLDTDFKYVFDSKPKNSFRAGAFSGKPVYDPDRSPQFAPFAGLSLFHFQFTADLLPMRARVEARPGRPLERK